MTTGLKCLFSTCTGFYLMCYAHYLTFLVDLSRLLMSFSVDSLITLNVLFQLFKSPAKMTLLGELIFNFFFSCTRNVFL